MKLERRGFVGIFLATLSTGVLSAKSWAVNKFKTIELGEALVGNTEKLVLEGCGEGHNGTKVNMMLVAKEKGTVRSASITLFLSEDTDPALVDQFKVKNRFHIRLTPISS